jgi:hypothetical protein
VDTRGLARVAAWNLTANAGTTADARRATTTADLRRNAGISTIEGSAAAVSGDPALEAEILAGFRRAIAVAGAAFSAPIGINGAAGFTVRALAAFDDTSAPRIGHDTAVGVQVLATARTASTSRRAVIGSAYVDLSSISSGAGAATVGNTSATRLTLFRIVMSGSPASNEQPYQ